MSARTIAINPITRLEGPGKKVFFDEERNMKNPYFGVPDLRGFEKFCERRTAEKLPIILLRICGVFHFAYHFVSTKALDAAFNVDTPAVAKKLGNLLKTIER